MAVIPSIGISKVHPSLKTKVDQIVSLAHRDIKENDFQLLSKIDKESIKGSKSYILKDWGTIPNAADSFGYVRVGKKSDASFSKEILSIYDKTGKLISHIFRTEGFNVKKNTYAYPSSGNRLIKFFDFVVHSSPDRKFPSPTFDNANGHWRNTASEFQIIQEESSHNNMPSSKRLLTKRINVLSSDPMKFLREFIFTRYPLTSSENKSAKQVVSAKIKDENGEKSIFDFWKKDIDSGAALNVSSNDKFLLFRFLGMNTREGLEALTRKLLKDKNLDVLNIMIYPEARFVSKNSIGHFSVWNQSIAYSPKLKEQNSLVAVNTIGHEVEHAYQYSQIGRLGKGRSSYETRAYMKLGDLKCNEVVEAIKYAEARDNYPNISDTEDLTKNIAYMTNYLEVKAREAGEKLQQEYVKANPDNYMFFDEFFR
ncbi:hypothetical protein HDR58_04080 [bacterium]|nr:hypothetical protein [bacterium]